MANDYGNVVNWIIKSNYKFNFASLPADIQGIIDKFKAENKGGFNIKGKNKTNFEDGVSAGLIGDSDYLKGRKDLIQETAEKILKDPSKFRDYIEEKKGQEIIEDEMNIPSLKRQFGAVQANEDKYEKRREEGRELTWEKIESSTFARSIKKGKTTSSFNSFYSLDPSEGDKIQRRLHEEYIRQQNEEESIRESEKTAERQAEIERKAVEEQIAREEEKAIEEATKGFEE